MKKKIIASMFCMMLLATVISVAESSNIKIQNTLSITSNGAEISLVPINATGNYEIIGNQ